MFKVSDHVKVIPQNLVEVSKSFYNYEYKLQESQGVDDPEVMLGGEYEIVEISKGGSVVQLLPNVKPEWKGMALTKHIKHVGDVRYCGFAAGDRVRWSRNRDVLNYSIADSLINSSLGSLSDSFIITGVINSYFIKLNNENLPLFWKDFEIV